MPKAITGILYSFLIFMYIYYW